MDQAACVPISAHFLTSWGHCPGAAGMSGFPPGQALRFCGMVDKSLPLSACVSSSINYRASSPDPDSMIVAFSLRVGGSRGQSQSTVICFDFLLTEVGLPSPAPGPCCKGWTVWLWPLPFSQRMWDRITPSSDLLWPPIKGSSPGASWAHGLSRGQPSPALPLVLSF